MYNIDYSVEEKLLVLPRLMNVNRNIKRGFQLRDMIAVCAKRDPLSHNIKTASIFLLLLLLIHFFVLIFLKKSCTHTCAHTHKIIVKIMILINKYK